MSDIVSVSIAGLKCDNETCDYRKDDVTFDEYESYLNAPCPKCGESLLTEADLKTAKELIALSGMFNKLGEDLDPYVDFDLDEDRVSIELEMKGDGSVTVGKIGKIT